MKTLLLVIGLAMLTACSIQTPYVKTSLRPATLVGANVSTETERELSEND